MAPAVWSQTSQQARRTLPAPAGVARQELCQEMLDNKIYVAGGLLNLNTGYSAHLEFYDLTRAVWARLGTIPEACHRITLTVINDQLHGVGGFSGGFPNWRARLPSPASRPKQAVLNAGLLQITMMKNLSIRKLSESFF